MKICGTYSAALWPAFLGLYIHLQTAALGDPLPKQSNKTTGSERRGPILVPGIALRTTWAQSHLAVA